MIINHLQKQDKTMKKTDKRHTGNENRNRSRQQQHRPGGGLRVRVLATGELGTVTDRVLMPGRDGRARPYVQVRLDNRPGLDRWFWLDQLGGTRERCRATFEAENGQVLVADLTMDYDKEKMSVKITGKPENIKEHHGLHAVLAAKLVEAVVARHGQGEA